MRFLLRNKSGYRYQYQMYSAHDDKSCIFLLLSRIPFTKKDSTRSKFQFVCETARFLSYSSRISVCILLSFNYAHATLDTKIACKSLFYISETRTKHIPVFYLQCIFRA